MGYGARFFKLAWQLDSRGVCVFWSKVRKQVLVFCNHGVKVREQVLEIWCQSASVWRHLSPTRKIDSISKGDPF